MAAVCPSATLPRTPSPPPPWQFLIHGRAGHGGNGAAAASTAVFKKPASVVPSSTLRKKPPPVEDDDAIDIDELDRLTTIFKESTAPPPPVVVLNTLPTTMEPSVIVPKAADVSLSASAPVASTAAPNPVRVSELPVGQSRTVGSLAPTAVAPAVIFTLPDEPDHISSESLSSSSDSSSSASEQQQQDGLPPVTVSSEQLQEVEETLVVKEKRQVGANELKALQKGAERLVVKPTSYTSDALRKVEKLKLSLEAAKSVVEDQAIATLNPKVAGGETPALPSAEEDDAGEELEDEDEEEDEDSKEAVPDPVSLVMSEQYVQAYGDAVAKMTTQPRTRPLRDAALAATAEIAAKLTATQAALEHIEKDPSVLEAARLEKEEKEKALVKKREAAEKRKKKREEKAKEKEERKKHKKSKKHKSKDKKKKKHKSKDKKGKKDKKKSKKKRKHKRHDSSSSSDGEPSDADDIDMDDSFSDAKAEEAKYADEEEEEEANWIVDEDDGVYIAPREGDEEVDPEALDGDYNAASEDEYDSAEEEKLARTGKIPGEGDEAEDDEDDDSEARKRRKAPLGTRSAYIPPEPVVFVMSSVVKEPKWTEVTFKTPQAGAAVVQSALDKWVKSSHSILQPPPPSSTPVIVMDDAETNAAMPQASLPPAEAPAPVSLPQVTPPPAQTPTPEPEQTPFIPDAAVLRQALKNVSDDFSKTHYGHVLADLEQRLIPHIKVSVDEAVHHCRAAGAEAFARQLQRQIDYFEPVVSNCARHVATNLLYLDLVDGKLVTRAFELATTTAPGRIVCPQHGSYSPSRSSPSMQLNFLNQLGMSLSKGHPTVEYSQRTLAAHYAHYADQGADFAHLALWLMHAQRLQLLKRAAMPERASLRYSCAISGRPIKGGEVVDWYRVTVETGGPLQGVAGHGDDAWDGPRPWESPSFRARCKTFVVRAEISEAAPSLRTGIIGRVLGEPPEHVDEDQTQEPPLIVKFPVAPPPTPSKPKPTPKRKVATNPRGRPRKKPESPSPTPPVVVEESSAMVVHLATADLSKTPAELVEQAEKEAKRTRKEEKRKRKEERRLKKQARKEKKEAEKKQAEDKKLDAEKNKAAASKKRKREEAVPPTLADTTSEAPEPAAKRQKTVDSTPFPSPVPPHPPPPAMEPAAPSPPTPIILPLPVVHALRAPETVKHLVVDPPPPAAQEGPAGRGQKRPREEEEQVNGSTNSAGEVNITFGESSPAYVVGSVYYGNTDSSLDDDNVSALTSRDKWNKRRRLLDEEDTVVKGTYLRVMPMKTDAEDAWIVPLDGYWHRWKAVCEDALRNEQTQHGCRALAGLLSAAKTTQDLGMALRQFFPGNLADAVLLLTFFARSLRHTLRNLRALHDTSVDDFLAMFDATAGAGTKELDAPPGCSSWNPGPLVLLFTGVEALEKSGQIEQKAAMPSVREAVDAMNVLRARWSTSGVNHTDSYEDVLEPHHLLLSSLFYAVFPFNT